MSRYSFIMFHVILRLAGQACGIAFAVMSWDDFTTRLNVLSTSFNSDLERSLTVIDHSRLPCPLRRRVLQLGALHVSCVPQPPRSHQNRPRSE